jgi:uncharacterized protein
MLFVVRSLATLVAPWIFFAWATGAFPWFYSSRSFRSFRSGPRRKQGLAALLVLFVVVDRVSDLMVVHWHTHGAGLVHAVFVVFFTTLILAAIPLSVLYAALWAIARLSPPRASPAPVATGATPAMTRRQCVEGVGGVALFGATGAMLGWGMVRGRHAFELREVPLRIRGLPRVLDGYVIAQISDIHSGAFVGERELDEGLALVRLARPDLIVVTGDLVDFDPNYAPIAARKLADLPARDGVAAVLGNHDYYAGADAVIATLAGAGIDVLRDAGRRIRSADGGGFALLGVDDLSSQKHGRGGPRLARALASVPPDLARILLSHQPSTVDAWAGRVDVQLSGHTHGGQINPGFSPAGLFMKYVAGAYEVKGTTLYVNRGFGTVGAPSRVGVPPEVTRIVLVAA